MNIQQVDAYLHGMIDAGITECCDVAMRRGNKLVYSLKTGFGGPENRGGKPLTDKSVFNVGSSTKPVTAMLIVKLIEQGKLILDDKVQKFLPEFQYDDVTIAHVLTHTAGYAYQEIGKIKWPEDQSGWEQYIQSIYACDRRGKINEEANYFTFLYSLLVLIIEKVSGMSFEAFAQQELFEPLGMSRTTFDVHKFADDFILPWDKNLDRFNVEVQHTPPTGDSGLISTALDMVKLGQALLDGEKSKVFSPGAIDLILKRECTGARFNRTMAFWLKMDKDMHTCFGDLNSPQAAAHTAFSGCMLLVDPTYDTTISIITNSMFLHDDWSNYRRICNVLMSLD